MLFYLFQLSIVELALVGEDQRSIDKNVDVIVSEWKKMHPDNRILAEKMKRTGPYRQKLCLEQSSSAVLEKFPCLQHHAFVCFVFIGYFILLEPAIMLLQRGMIC